MCVEAPNDLKLSDSGVRPGSCAVGLRGAGAVTAVAVRCSAWLGACVGDRAIVEETRFDGVVLMRDAVIVRVGELAVWLDVEMPETEGWMRGVKFEGDPLTKKWSPATWRVQCS